MMTVEESKIKVVQDLDNILGSLERKLSEHGVNPTYKGECVACNQAIHGEVCTAFGETWHPDHFVCELCKTNLWTKDFYEREGKPYCESDYQKQFAPKCFACNEPVLSVSKSLFDV